jgi:hypothetical protein
MGPVELVVLLFLIAVPVALGVGVVYLAIKLYDRKG